MDEYFAAYAIQAFISFSLLDNIGSVFPGGFIIFETGGDTDPGFRINQGRAVICFNCAPCPYCKGCFVNYQLPIYRFNVGEMSGNILAIAVENTIFGYMVNAASGICLASF